MNVIVNKLDLPHDIKEVIESYCCNKLGYTYENLKVIEKIKEKKKNKFMKLRQQLELAQWYNLGVSVNWLRPGQYGRSVYNKIQYGRGVYGKRHPYYGLGTLSESMNFQYYNSDNDYIGKLIQRGELVRSNAYLSSLIEKLVKKAECVDLI